MSDLIKRVETKRAPKAIGPYSQGVIAGKYIFISGQIAIDPSTGKFVEGEIKEQTTQVINNIKVILESQGIGLDKVVKSEVYLTDIRDFQYMNEVYASMFSSDPKPARQVAEVSKLPLNAKIEIPCIAYLKK